MKLSPFKLERYFDQYEFTARYLLSSSDCQPLRLHELLALAQPQTKNEWDNLSLGYTKSKGNLQLREEICQLYKSIQPENVLVLAPEEGIFIAMNVLLDKGDHAVVTFPGYQSLYQVAEDMGCRVSKWEPDRNLKFVVDDLRSLITDKTKLIVINFPHNPTGATMPLDELKEIIALADARGIVIFSDEMYRLMEYEETDRLPSVSDLYENAVSLFGLSKTFGLPGLRIGWLTTQNKSIYHALASFKDYTTICNNAPGENLGIIALQNKTLLANRSLGIIRKNLAVLESFASRHAGWFLWQAPKAGSIAFPELKIKGSVTELCQDLFQATGIMLLPHSVYDFNRPHVRFGFGRSNFSEALGAFEKYIEGSSGKFT